MTGWADAEMSLENSGPRDGQEAGFLVSGVREQVFSQLHKGRTPLSKSRAVKATHRVSQQRSGGLNTTPAGGTSPPGSDPRPTVSV